MPDVALTVEHLLTALTVVATATMALSGVIQAIRHQFDPLGAVVLALITATGGGSLRDMLLGATPVFWITDIIYIATVIPVAILGIVFARKMASGGGRRDRTLNYADAIGLALFTILGVYKSLEFGAPPPVAVILGCITGVAGGMLRDLLCGEQPSVLKEDLYATVSLVGGTLFVMLNQWISLEANSLICFLVIVACRFWVIRRALSLKPLG